MKKVISLFLSMIMLFSVGSFSITAYASEGAGALDVEKLKYDTMDTKFSIPSSTIREYDGVSYYSDGKELYNKLRDAMDKRKTIVKLHYYNSNTFMNNLYMASRVRDMVKNAWSDELSVTSTDGDYAHWSVSSADYEYESSKAKYFDITIKLGYYSTANEEKQVDKEINSIVTSIRKKSWSDYQILKYVHDEICRRTAYDYDALEDPEEHYHAFAAYGALLGREVVCQGYALAFYRICRELGYDVRLAYSDDHAWNIVILDGKAYYVDCTWDDQIIDEDLQEFDGDYHYYFLVDYYTLRSQDDDSFSHLLDAELDTDEYFIDKYMNITADIPYRDNNIPKLSSCSSTIEYSAVTYNATPQKPSVVVKDADGTKLVEGKNYTVSYSKNTNCGRAVVNIKGLGKYSGMISRRTFVIKPRTMQKPSVATNGRTNSSLDIKWDNPGGAVSGYQLQCYQNEAWQTVGTVDSSTKVHYLVKNLSPGKKYQFRARAYRTVGRVNYYGEPSKTFVTYTSPSTPSSLSLKTGSSKITASWKKVTCTGYEIQYSTSSNMSGAKIVKASATATSKAITSLKKGKKYYVRIRSYKTATINGKSYTYRSSWSGKKSIVVK